MSESESEKHVGRLSPPLCLCLSVDTFGGKEDRVMCLQVTKPACCCCCCCCCTGMIEVRQGMCAGGREGQQEAEAEAEGGGLEGVKERSHRVVDAAMRVNDWWRRVRGTFYGRKTTISGSACGLQGTGSEDGDGC